MALVYTKRFHLPQWSASSAEPGPDESIFIKAFAQIESALMRTEQGSLSARRGAKWGGSTYYATDKGLSYLDLGASWIVLASRVYDALRQNSGPNHTPLAVTSTSDSTSFWYVQTWGILSGPTYVTIDTLGTMTVNANLATTVYMADNSTGAGAALRAEANGASVGSSAVSVRGDAGFGGTYLNEWLSGATTVATVAPSGEMDLASELTLTTAQVDGLLTAAEGEVAPTGTVLYWAANAQLASGPAAIAAGPPAGYTYADGRLLLKSSYPNLYALIGDEFTPAGTDPAYFGTPNYPAIYAQTA